MRKVRLLGVVVALAILAGCSSAPDQVAVAPPEVVLTSSTASTASAVSTTAGPEPFDASQLDRRVTQATIGSTIAVRGYTARVRPPQSVTQPIKLSLMRQHGCVDPPSAYELDHFIPLELGGSSDLSNLWLEPIAEARKKDVDENLAHARVCSGVWTLARGQQYIRQRWRIHYADEPLVTPMQASSGASADAIKIVGSVSDTTPPQATPVTVFAAVTDGLGKPVAGVRVGFIWHFKTLTRTDWAVTDSSGVASDTRQIGRATKGYRVNIDLVVDSAGSPTGSASFVSR